MLLSFSVLNGIFFVLLFCMIVNEERGTDMHGIIIILGLHPEPFHHHLDMRETIITLGPHPEPFHHHLDMRETTITLGLHPDLFHHHLEMRETTGPIRNHYLQEGTVGVHLDLVLTVASDSGARACSIHQRPSITGRKPYKCWLEVGGGLVKLKCTTMV